MKSHDSSYPGPWSDPVGVLRGIRNRKMESYELTRNRHACVTAVEQGRIIMAAVPMGECPIPLPLFF